MANYCWNRLYVIGPEDGVNRFTEDAIGVSDNGEAESQESQELPLDFDSLVPSPKHSELESLGFRDLVSWRNAAWGTKWIDGPTAYFERPSPETAFYRFTTAWSPPKSWVRSVASQYPELQFLLSYDHEDSDGLVRTFCARAKGADEEQLLFDEGYLLFDGKSGHPDWEQAMRQAESPDVKALLRHYDEDELARIFDDYEFSENLTDSEAADLLAEKLKTLPEDVRTVENELLGALRIELTHPDLGRATACLVGCNVDEAFLSEMQERQSELDDRNLLARTVRKEPEIRTELLDIYRAELDLDEREVKSIEDSLWVRSLYAFDQRETTKPEVGQAILRLASCGVLDKAGLTSEWAS